MRMGLFFRFFRPFMGIFCVCVMVALVNLFDGFLMQCLMAAAIGVVFASGVCLWQIFDRWRWNRHADREGYPLEAHPPEDEEDNQCSSSP